MSVNLIPTIGFGNGQLQGNINSIITLGFTVNRSGTSEIRNSLINNAALSNSVGSRIYRGKLPDNPTYPCILYRSSEDPENTLSGRSDLIHRLYEFEIYAENYVDIERIAFDLRVAMGDGSFTAVLTDLNDDNYQNESRVFSMFLDFSVWQ